MTINIVVSDWFKKFLKKTAIILEINPASETLQI